jgi:hypothetical protein
MDGRHPRSLLSKAADILCSLLDGMSLETLTVERHGEDVFDCSRKILVETLNASVPLDSTLRVYLEIEDLGGVCVLVLFD